MRIPLLGHLNLFSATISNNALLVIFGVALALILSCSSDNEGGTSVVYGTPVSYDGEIYETVVIGKQTWMARNLNYDAPGSVCYDNDSANCAIYGRLYKWTTAMDLPEECRGDSDCTDQIKKPHQGICPVGWHIPSVDDWNELDNYVKNWIGGMPWTGKYLRAKSGWKESDWGDGEDSFGFAALPGGFSRPSGSFEEGGCESIWWSSDFKNSYQSYYFTMSVLYVEIKGGFWNTSSFSVRCVKD